MPDPSRSDIVVDEHGTEIEAAIENLSPSDYRDVWAWVEEHQAMADACEALFTMYDWAEADRSERS